MSGDAERWRRESDAWKKWEGWVPGDPIPGEIPGLARSDQPTTRHPPTGRRRRPTAVPPPPPPPGARQRRSASPTQSHVPPPPPPGSGGTVARSAVRYASARAARAGGRAGQSPASAARGCLVGVAVMFVVFGGLVPACLATVADRISDEGSSGGVGVSEATSESVLVGGVVVEVSSTVPEG